MKRTFLAAAVVAGLGLTVGCNKSEPGGNTATGDQFKVSKESVSLKPKEKKSVKLGITRSGGFNEAVNFTLGEVPKGLTANLASKTANADTKEVVLEVEAAENAQPGDNVIKVTAKPEKTGKETLTEVKVTVEKP